MRTIKLFTISLLLTTLSSFTSFASLESEFERVPDAAEYQGASWDNLISIERGLTLDEAYEIAKNNPDIGYFFHTVGWQMVLDTPQGFQVFHAGDTAFFSGKPWWGEATDLADGYVRR